MKLNIEKTWQNHLSEEINKKYFKDLVYYVKNQYDNRVCYPNEQLIFSAFNNCGLDNLKVVILGQDPYHGPNQANGLCFSVDLKVVNPPSLNNIFKEISVDLSCKIRKNSDLLDWSRQGVLLLNSVLTVEDGLPGSHSKKGWEKFTDKVLSIINNRKTNVVFILWGKKAQEKGKFLDHKKHLILESAHPSPFSAYNGFFGSKPFSKTNEYLKKNNAQPINWQL